MRAKEGVIDRLNALLTNDLTVINQYFVQAEMMRNWGYERLHDAIRDLSMGEMKDAEALIRHILFLEGLPNMQRMNQVKIGESVEEDLRLDLESEMEACDALRETIEHCQQVGDHATRDILEDMLTDEEEHVDWFETQHETIRQIGIAHYLAQQMHD